MANAQAYNQQQLSSFQNAFKNNLSNAGGKVSVNPVTPSVQSAPAVTTNAAPSYSSPASNSNLNLKALNDIVYFKNAYENAQSAGKGADSLKYITGQAQGAYGQLDQSTQNALRGMNASQASEYYRNLMGKNQQTAMGQQQQAAPEAVDPYADFMNNPFIQQMMQQINGYGQQMSAYQSQMAAYQQAQQDQMKQQYQSLLDQYGQAQSAELAAMDRDYEGAKSELEDASFQQYLNARQAMANRGLAGSGLANDQDTRLLMANSKNLAGLQNNLLNNKAAVQLRYGSQMDNLQNQIASMTSIPLSAGGVTASRTQTAGAPFAPDDTTLDYTMKMLQLMMPYTNGTVKDQMDYELELAKALGYTSDGQYTLDARDKAATQNRLMSELLGYTPDGTLTREARKDENALLHDYTKLFGYDANGNTTLDYNYKMGTLDQGQQKIDLDAWYKGNTLDQNQQKIDIDSYATQNKVAQNWQQVEQGWADVQTRQQNANTRLQELDLNKVKFANQQEKDAFTQQIDSAKSLMNIAYKDMESIRAKMNASPAAKKDQNLINQYNEAKRNYDLYVQTVDTLAQIGVNPKTSSGSGNQVSVNNLFSGMSRLLNGATSLGSLSRKYESGGNAATIARNPGDPGGASYGTYQFATNKGTPQRFVEYLKNVDQTAYKALSGKTPGSAEFDKAWKSLASSNKNFANYQHDFTVKSYYEPAMNSLKTNLKLDISKRPQAIQDAVYSTAVQHGSGSVSKIFKSAGITSAMSDREIIERLYKERAANNGYKYFKSSDTETRNSVVKRLNSEMKDALKMIS